jgi:hypothetical protein
MISAMTVKDLSIKLSFRWVLGIVVLVMQLIANLTRNVHMNQERQERLSPAFLFSVLSRSILYQFINLKIVGVGGKCPHGRGGTPVMKPSLIR